MSNESFKVGDRVVCIRAYLWSHRPDCPVVGGIYTVGVAEPWVGPGFVGLEEFHGGWSKSEFALAKDNFPLASKPEPSVDYRAFGSRAEQALKAPAKDNVNLPEHYARFKIEPVRFCMENKLDPFQFNVIKYICRHDSKNGIEDIDKVIRYATMYRKFLLGDADWWKA